MDTATSSKQVDEADPTSTSAGNSVRIDGAAAETKIEAAQTSPSKSKSSKKRGAHRRRSHAKKHSSKRGKKDAVSSSNEDSSSDSASSDSETSSATDSDSDDTPRRKSHKRSPRDKQAKNKKRRNKPKPSDSDSDEDSNDSSSESSSDEEPPRRRKGARKTKKSSRHDDYSEDDSATDDDEDDCSDDDAGDDDDDDDDEIAQLKDQIARLELRRQGSRRGRGGTARGGRNRSDRHQTSKKKTKSSSSKSAKKKTKSKKKTVKKASTLEYKRVDQLWDSSIHDYKLTESAEAQEDEFQEYIFTVRRKFDWENKYKSTVVDIKSKPLRDALQEVMKDVKGVSLVEEQPNVDPNMLFLYLEELRTFTKKTLRTRAKSERKKKAKRLAKTMRSHCKVLLEYLDEDYDETKKTLYPMLEAGNITFDLLWALFKPNTIAFTNTYGAAEHPRAFKVDYANRESSFMRGEWYCIEGRYLEYDGKSFGLGDFEVDVDNFKGARKITSLSTYPLRYHKDPEGIKKQLIERGKRFVALEGMNYRFHKGLAFVKKKKVVGKVNINGRIMIDPAIFRRINPNYPISTIRPKDQSYLFGDDNDDDDDDDSSCSCNDEDDEEGHPKGEGPAALEATERTKFKVLYDEEKDIHRVVEVPVDAEGNELQVENIEKLADNGDTKREFTEEELLLASPVVLGFAFSEKLWLEFSLSGVCDIEWNEGAFDSLVLPPNQKSIVRALVESHKFDAAKTIDDVVQGKGRGLVAVLHGPPGTGKTLTAEGIAELLKCPLYMVSAGELGTDPRMLEHELQKILDIAHSWGAVLLLDEADVFLEKREVHDIHRNALVSIFLRLLEYFQGILFLTTNRVETFDDAFQSRIHVALRYGDLTTKAKRTIWKMFLEKVKAMEMQLALDESSLASSLDSTHDTPNASSSETAVLKKEPSNFSDVDYDNLARRIMNGRQIKNAVRTAQALAVNERTPMNMEHIKRVLDVAESFDRDLRGGTGYTEAMRSYT